MGGAKSRFPRLAPKMRKSLQNVFKKLKIDQELKSAV